MHLSQFHSPRSNASMRMWSPMLLQLCRCPQRARFPWPLMLFNMLWATVTPNLQCLATLAAEEALLRVSDQRFLRLHPLRIAKALQTKLRLKMMSKPSKMALPSMISPKLSLKRMKQQQRRRSSTTKSTPFTTWRTLKVMIRMTAALSTLRKTH